MRPASTRFVRYWLIAITLYAAYVLGWVLTTGTRPQATPGLIGALTAAVLAEPIERAIHRHRTRRTTNPKENA